jgi:hypothetical protein
MRRRYLLVVLVTSILFSPSPARGAVTAWTAVVVRVYDTSGTMSGTNKTALDLAKRTLSSASIEVVWRMCAARCNAPMAPGELAIRIVRSPVPDRYRGMLPLGDALIDTSASSGVLATIYLDRVLWLARESQADSRALLGHAIAHELGHLLLATSAHGPVGLMRGVWSQEEVRRGHPSDWRFAPQEIAAMRRRAEARRLAASAAWGTK